jgi:hypothetical protein
VSRAPDRGLTPGQAGLLTVGRKVILTLTRPVVGETPFRVEIILLEEITALDYRLHNRLTD